jgi:hypothetical protein
MEKAVPALANGRDDPLLAAGTHLDSFDGIRQAQVSRDPYRLAAIAQKQLGDTGHSKPRKGYTRSLSLSGADDSCLQCIEISGFQQWVGRQDPIPAHATGHQANDGAHADSGPTDAGLASQHGRVVRDP